MKGCIKQAFIILLCNLFGLPTIGLYAQQANEHSLNDLVQHALQYSPDLMSKQFLINSSIADKQSIKDEFIPTAIIGDEALIATDNSLPGSYLSMGVIPSTSSGIRASNNAQPATGDFALVMSQYELASFGYKNARLKNADAVIELNKSDKDRDEYLLKWRLSKLYFVLIREQLQLSIEAQNVNRYQDLFKVIRGITLSGLKPGVDSSQALAELSKTRIDYSNALKQMQLTKQEISYLTGINVKNITADTTETAHQISVMQIMNSLSDSTKIPLLEYYKTKENLYVNKEDLISKSYRPHLMLTGMAWARGSSIDYNSNYKSLETGLGYQRFNYMAGLSLFYNLSSLIQKRDRLKSGKQQAMAAQFDVEQQKESLENISNQADEILTTASNDLKEIPVQLKAATDAFNQKTAQYKAGLINLVDLTNANYILYRAQTDYAQALNDWFLANVDKAASTGKLDLFIQSLK